MKIINVHTHIIKKPAEYGRDGKITDLIKDMKIGGVSKSLIISLWDHTSDIDYSLKELFEIAKDERFGIIYTLNADKNLKLQLKDAEEYFKKRLIKGIKILLGYQQIMPDDSKLYPFYKLCIKYNYPVIFHAGDTLGSRAKLVYSHPLNIDSLAVDMPELKIIIAHLGNPWILDAAEVIYKNANVYGDISGLFLDSQIKDPRYYRFMAGKVNGLIAYAGGSKLLFGTDFPLMNSTDYIKFVKSLNLTAEELELIFYKNAEKLFRF